MKKLILISGVVFCLWQLAHSATPITIPGSQFPVVTTPSNDMRFLMVYPPGGLDPNPLKGSNATIRYDSLVAALELVITSPTNGQSAAQVAAQIAATNNTILVNLYDPIGTALSIGGNNSNLTYLVAQQNTNLTFSVGQNNTNLSYSIGQAATNAIIGSTNGYSWQSNLWVSTTGNDTTGNGMSNNPFASVTKAISVGGSQASIIVRSGDYSMSANGGLNVSGKKLTITGCPGERVKFWATYTIPASSFVSLSNGIYTASGSILSGFTNCLEVSTNTSIQTGFHPQGFLVYGSNSPSGAQTFSEFYPPKLLSSFGETNRCEFTAIGQGASVPSIVNSNAWWVLTNQIFYVKFPVSNSPTMIMTSSTNQSDIFITSGDAISDVSLNGLEFYGFKSTLACTNVGKWSMSRCMIAMPNREFTAVNNCVVSDCEYVYLNDGAIYYNDKILLQPTITFNNCFFHDYTGDNGGLLLFGGSGASLIGTFNAIVNNPMVYGGTNGQWGIISDGAYVYINGGIVVVDSISSSPLQIGCSSPLGKISYMAVNGTKIMNRVNGAGLRLNDSNDVVNLNNVNFDMGVGASAVAIQGITAGHVVTLQGVTRNDQGTIISAPGSTVIFKNFAGFGLDSGATVAAYLINGLNSTGESIIGNGTVRANNGFGLFLHGSAVSTRLDQNGNFFIATNSTVPSTASFNGDMLLSNTNATDLWLYKSSMGGTAWTSRNLILLDNSALNGANISAGTLPITAADTSWPSRTNYPHSIGPLVAGNVMIFNGTFDSFGSPNYTNGTPSGSGSQTPWTSTIDAALNQIVNLGNVIQTNGNFLSTNSQGSSIDWDTNHVFNIRSNGTSIVSGNPATGTLTSKKIVVSSDGASMLVTNSLNGGYTLMESNKLTTGSGTFNGGTSNYLGGVTISQSGIGSTRSNLLAPTSFTFPATTVNWTNPITTSIEVYIDNGGITGTAIKKNGTTISSSVVGDATLGLQPGEYFSETYTVGTPTGKWSPFP